MNGNIRECVHLAWKEVEMRVESKCFDLERAGTDMDLKL